MIQANELRIGNYVIEHYYTGNRVSKTVKVKTVSFEYGHIDITINSDIEHINQILFIDKLLKGIDAHFYVDKGIIRLTDFNIKEKDVDKIITVNDELLIYYEVWDKRISKFSGDWNNMYKYDPISLTDNLLIKLEFKKSIGDLRNESNAITVYENDEILLSSDFNLLDYTFDDCHDVWYYYILDRKIQYLHELQNLYFALSGKELDIKSDVL